MTPDDDLRSLAPVEPPGALTSRVRRVAHGELAAARGSRGSPWRVIAARWWTRVALPAVIACAVVGYLHWAIRAASALYR
jgi:hypothetical protein